MGADALVVLSVECSGRNCRIGNGAAGLDAPPAPPRGTADFPRTVLNIEATLDASQLAVVSDADTYTVTATSDWVITWQGAGQSGTIPLDGLTRSVQISIGEAQVLVQ